MANNNVRTAVIRGKTSFAKILGAPVLNYSKDGKEWKLDLVIDKNSVKEVKALGIGDRVKSKDDYLDGQSYLTFKQSELKRDGTPNFPIKVEDIAGRPWPQDKLLGNGTDVDVKFVVMDHGVGKKHGVYIRSVRVLNHIPYERSEFDRLDENDPFAAQLAEAEAMAAERKEREDKQFKQDFGIEEDADDLDGEMPV